MYEFASLPIEERIPYFQEVANRRKLTPVIVEKDFWVCFILQCLFSTAELKDNLIFKGGTSLSKGFGIIERFSEDIDLTIHPTLLGFDSNSLPNPKISNSERKKRSELIKSVRIDKVKNELKESLEKKICHIIGTPSPQESYFRYDDNEGALYFRYPTIENTSEGYIPPQVKLEFGSHGGIGPSETLTIIPWVAEEFPDAFKNASTEVVALSPERTFWEKAIILHAEYYRPLEKAMRSRHSRDLYDVYFLSKHESGQKALKDLSLLATVVENTQLYFYAAWPKYDLAKPETLRLAPNSQRITDLKIDYKKMEEMIYGRQPDFDEIIEQLIKIEQTLNAA